MHLGQYSFTSLASCMISKTILIVQKISHSQFFFPSCLACFLQDMSAEAPLARASRCVQLAWNVVWKTLGQEALEESHLIVLF